MMAIPQTITAYRVKDWNRVHENYTTRKLPVLRMVQSPNSFGTSGYRALEDQPDEIKIPVYCAFHLILCVASQCPQRGLLIDNDGRAITAKMLRRKTGFPEQIFDLAFDVLTDTEKDICWLETVEVQVAEKKTLNPTIKIEISPALPPALHAPIINPCEQDRFCDQLSEALFLGEQTAKRQRASFVALYRRAGAERAGEFLKIGSEIDAYWQGLDEIAKKKTNPIRIFQARANALLGTTEGQP
jgi:hypothetical protein